VKDNIIMSKLIENLNFDIFQLDELIRSNIDSEKLRIKQYKKRLKEIEHDKSPNASNEKREIKEVIVDLENNNKLAEYTCLVQNKLSEYLELVKQPKQVNFFKPKIKPNNEIETKRKELLSSFISIAKQFIQIDEYETKQDENGIKCSCGNSTSFKETDSSIICENCAREYQTCIVNTTFKDTDRVNMSQKYRYKRKVHFKDTINQYEGNQNKKIDKKVFDVLEKEFKKHSLLCIGDTFFSIHKRITKEHIYMFLQETNNPSYYEDLNFIHRYFTGIPCPNITYLKADLYQDFDMVIDAYDTLNNDRKNFINSQYVLYQLLKRRGIKVKEEDFSILKTRERLIEHNKIYGAIAEILEWNWFPLL
jgi:hypothetical protein